MSEDERRDEPVNASESADKDPLSQEMPVPQQPTLEQEPPQDIPSDMPEFGGELPDADLGGLGNATEPRQRKEKPAQTEVPVFTVKITPSIATRIMAYWMHPNRLPDERRGTSWPVWDDMATLYLEGATYRDALSDELREPSKDNSYTDATLYSWPNLHMAGMKPLLEAERKEMEKEIAQTVRREANRALIKRIKDAAKQPETVTKEDLLELIAEEEQTLNA